MMLSKRFLLLILFICIYGCKGNAEIENLHRDAFKTQQQVIKTIKEIRQLLEADTPKVKNEILTEIQEIEEAMFAIPGHSLHLPGHEGHDHSHDIPKLSAQEILSLQEDLLLRVKKIRSAMLND